MSPVRMTDGEREVLRKFLPELERTHDQLAVQARLAEQMKERADRLAAQVAGLEARVEELRKRDKEQQVEIGVRDNTIVELRELIGGQGEGLDVASAAISQLVDRAALAEADVVALRSENARLKSCGQEPPCLECIACLKLMYAGRDEVWRIAVRKAGQENRLCECASCANLLALMRSSDNSANRKLVADPNCCCCRDGVCDGNHALVTP